MKPQQQTEALDNSHGTTHGLSVGIDNYPPNVEFPKLRKCSENAAQISIVFSETPQLNTDSSHIRLRTSETIETPPTRGEIINQLKAIAAQATEEDRLLFYFSGHAHRLADIEDLYLVPQDVYDENDPGAMISFNQVRNILGASSAKTILAILDTCLSGPKHLGKRPNTSVFDNFLKEYIQHITGLAVIASCEPDEASFEKSLHPKLSLFTSVLIPALRGKAEALDQRFLTLSSLYDHVSTKVQRVAKSMQLQPRPTYRNEAPGTLVLGDFRAPFTPPDQLEFSEHPVSALIIKDTKAAYTSDILTEWKNKSTPLDQLEYAANRALDEYLEDGFSKYRSQLRKKLGFSSSETDNSDASFQFPGGQLTYSFKTSTKGRGNLLRELSLDADWFDDPERTLTLLDIFDYQSDEFIWELRTAVNPLEKIPAFESKGWETDSESKRRVVFKLGRVTMIVEQKQIIFNGIDIKEILEIQDEEDTDISRIKDTFQML